MLLKKGEVQQQTLDVNEVVIEVLKLARSDLTSHGVIVDTALASDLAAIRGDGVQLQQVLLNLVMNACDAMADNVAKDRRLTVRTLSAGGAGVRIEVSDVGRGLPAGGAERAFERYFTTKAHGPRARALSLPHDHHGARRHAWRDEQRGAWRHVSLHPAAGEGAARMNERAPTVFVVDDDAAVRKAVARLLHSVRIEVAAFASPVEFLAAYDPERPGCLLLDLEMPGLNGLELQQALTKRGGALPIIFLSAYGDVPISVQAMKARRCGFPHQACARRRAPRGGARRV